MKWLYFNRENLGGQEFHTQQVIHLSLIFFRSVFAGLTTTVYLIWFFCLLPHPYESKWLTLTHKMPNALLINVLGFNGNIPTQYEQQGESMPWLGGWFYLGPALIVGISLLITAVGFGRLQRNTTTHRWLRALLLAIPFSMLLMSIVCSLINLAGPSCWQAFVQDQPAIVYQGIIIPQIKTLWPLLCLATLYVSLVFTLQWAGFKSRFCTQVWSLNLILYLLALLGVLTRMGGMWITGPQPFVHVMEGGYNSAKFLILASLLWIALQQTTRILHWKHHLALTQQPSAHPWPPRFQLMIRLLVILVCLILGYWLLKLILIFSDLPSQRWCSIAFYHTAGMGQAIQLTAAGFLLLVGMFWYRALLSGITAKAQ